MSIFRFLLKQILQYGSIYRETKNDQVNTPSFFFIVMYKRQLCFVGIQRAVSDRLPMEFTVCRLTIKMHCYVVNHSKGSRMVKALEFCQLFFGESLPLCVVFEPPASYLLPWLQ